MTREWVVVMQQEAVTGGQLEAHRPDAGSGVPVTMRVPAGQVLDAVADARSPVPVGVHRSVALSVARGSEKTAKLRLERLARVVLAAGVTDDPAVAWSTDWSMVPVEVYEALDRSIRGAWDAASTRNAMRDAPRAVIRACRDAGLMTHDAASVALSALRPEKQGRDEEKQSRGHVSSEEVAAVFERLAADPGVTARRDAAMIALLVGAGLRRGEVVSLELGDLDSAGETLVVTGKGGAVRTVPLAPGVRRAVADWLEVRGREPGPLLTPMSKEVPRVAVLDRALHTATVAQVVTTRFGDEVAPHDLRRTFVGDLLDAGADLSVVSSLVGHTNPATTAGYDRRGVAARRVAVEKLGVPYVRAGES